MQHILTYISIESSTYIHCIHALKYTHTHTHTHICIHIIVLYPHICTRIHTYTLSPFHMNVYHTHAQTHTHTHTRTHARTNTHTHTHTHTHKHYRKHSNLQHLPKVTHMSIPYITYPYKAYTGSLPCTHAYKAYTCTLPCT